MRTIVFLKNNPAVEDALEQESSPPVDRPEIAIHTKKERAREIFFFFLKIIILNICDLYLHLLNVWEIRGQRIANIGENNCGKRGKLKGLKKYEKCREIDENKMYDSETLDRQIL